MEFIQEIFTALTEIVSQVGNLIGSVFQSAVSLIYDGEGLTVIGILTIISAAVGLFFFALRWVRGLIKLK